MAYIFLQKGGIEMLESKFQADLIIELKRIFEGCYILKNDPNYIQGFPDLLILYNNRWAALEVKRGPRSHRQPNQEYYIQDLDSMSYANFIYPQNKEEVLDELQSALQA